MRKWIGILCILLGVACLLAAVGFLLYNRWEADTAEETSQELLQDVRAEMKELTKSVDQHAERIATCEAQIASAFKSIQRIEQRINLQQGE